MSGPPTGSGGAAAPGIGEPGPRSLRSAFTWSSAQAVLKLALALALVKLLAAVAGPTGLATFGQVQGLVTVVGLISAAPWTSAVIRYAVVGPDGGHEGAPGSVAPMPEARVQFHATALGAALTWSLAVAVVLWITAGPLARFATGGSTSTGLVRLLAVSSVSASAATVYVAFVLADGRLRTALVTQTATQLVGGLGSILGFVLHRVPGAVFGLVTGQLAAGLLVLLVLRGSAPGVGRALRTPAWLRSATLRPFVAVAAVVLASSVGDQVVQLLIRARIESVRSLTDLGYWQALTRLSDAYLFVVGAVLVSAYQPALRRARTRAQTRAVVGRTAALVLPLTLASALVVYLSRGWLVPLLLSGAFAPVSAHLPEQLVGDVLRIVATLVGLVLLVRGSPVVFVATELAYSVVYFVLAQWWVAAYGWPGAVWAFVVAHLVYLALVWPFVRRQLAPETPDGESDRRSQTPAR